MTRFVRPRAIALVAAGALSIAAVSVSVSAMAQVDAAKSSVTATGKQLGVPMDIKFGKFDGSVHGQGRYRYQQRRRGQQGIQRRAEEKGLV